MVNSPIVEKLNNAIALTESNNNYSVINNKDINNNLKPVNQWAIGKYQHYYKYYKNDIKEALKNSNIDIKGKTDSEIANLYSQTLPAQELVQNKLTNENLQVANKLINIYQLKAPQEEIAGLIHYLGKKGAEDYIKLFKQYGQIKADQIMAYGDKQNHPDINPIGGPDSTKPNRFISDQIIKIKDNLN